MNRLAKEGSPYLQQHADNPVYWYPWNEEALRQAVKEDKPILLSIGYSTCHWCHVMERESFKDNDVAAYMNAHFINIKVDREERPDLDQFYMEACQVLTGQAGWPLNLFLTPDKRPYYGGTYFPPEPMGRNLSWFQALQYAAYNYYENRPAVEKQADKIIRKMQSRSEGALPLTGQASGSEDAVMKRMLEQVRQKEDADAGGFGLGAKYPNTTALQFLLIYARRNKDENAADHVYQTLDHMLKGGMYDLIGGGWSRYATDRYWKIPHFEKMLYDNALMVSLMSEAYQYRPKESYKAAIQATLTFVASELQSPEGGFYSALDADTDGEEGSFYTWEKAEIEELLQDDAGLFNAFYDIRAEGNWEEGKNILHAPLDKEAFVSHQEGLVLPFFEDFLGGVHQKLASARAERRRPHRDEKMILSWNALQAIAYMDAYFALGLIEYKAKAKETMRCLQRNFEQQDHLLHAVLSGAPAGVNTFLNDYGFYIQALIKAYTLDWELDFLRRAKKWLDIAMEKFFDPTVPAFFFTEKNNTELLFQQEEWEDSEMPSATAIMVENLKKLGLLFADSNLDQRADQLLERMKVQGINDPFPMTYWASLMVNHLKGWKEIAVTGPNAFREAEKLRSHFLPGVVIMASQKAEQNWPLLAFRFDEKKDRFFVCENHTCKAPVFTVEAVLKAL